jgi:low temperature requirement protein LtrA
MDGWVILLFVLAGIVVAVVVWAVYWKWFRNRPTTTAEGHWGSNGPNVYDSGHAVLNNGSLQTLFHQPTD